MLHFMFKIVLFLYLMKPIVDSSVLFLPLKSKINYLFISSHISHSYMFASKIVDSTENGFRNEFDYYRIYAFYGIEL